jgi:hypothetical protein
MAVILYIAAMLSIVYDCLLPFNSFKYAENYTLLY